MRVIRFGIFVAVSLFIVLTAFSFLFPSDIRISRVVNVSADRQRVYTAVTDLRAWNDWNRMIDPDLLTNIRYSQPSAGPGAFMRSDQLRVTEGQADSEGVRMTWDLTNGKRFAGGFEFLSVNADSITVQWWFDLHFRWYPWEKLGVFVYDRKLGPVMEESLERLKQYVEKPR